MELGRSGDRADVDFAWRSGGAGDGRARRGRGCSPIDRQIPRHRHCPASPIVSPIPGVRGCETARATCDSNLRSGI